MMESSSWFLCCDHQKYYIFRYGWGGGDSFFYFGAETFRLWNEQGQSLCLYFNEKATQFIKILDIVKKKLILFI